jgi:FlaA1/EpsC-like NDP-sugar epimerase
MKLGFFGWIMNFLRSRRKRNIQCISVTSKIRRIIDKEKLEVIYHAAYKHVPISQSNPSEYIATNVCGTKNIIELVKSRPFIKKFCLISTDKAANPSNVMGATKRLAEILVIRELKDNEEKKLLLSGLVMF